MKSVTRVANNGHLVSGSVQIRHSMVSRLPAEKGRIATAPGDFQSKGLLSGTLPACGGSVVMQRDDPFSSCVVALVSEGRRTSAAVVDSRFECFEQGQRFLVGER